MAGKARTESCMPSYTRHFHFHRRAAIIPLGSPAHPISVSMKRDNHIPFREIKSFSSCFLLSSMHTVSGSFNQVSRFNDTSAYFPLICHTWNKCNNGSGLDPPMPLAFPLEYRLHANINFNCTIIYLVLVMEAAGEIVIGTLKCSNIIFQAFR